MDNCGDNLEAGDPVKTGDPEEAKDKFIDECLVSNFDDVIYLKQTLFHNFIIF
jgi:hypothetical protein